MNFIVCDFLNLQEQSFTCTLIMAFENFDALETKEDIMSFFNATFPDFVQVMGE